MEFLFQIGEKPINIFYCREPTCVNQTSRRNHFSDHFFRRRIFFVFNYTINRNQFPFGTIERILEIYSFILNAERWSAEVYIWNKIIIVSKLNTLFLNFFRHEESDWFLIISTKIQINNGPDTEFENPIWYIGLFFWCATCSEMMGMKFETTKNWIFFILFWMIWVLLHNRKSKMIFRTKNIDSRINIQMRTMRTVSFSLTYDLTQFDSASCCPITSTTMAFRIPRNRSQILVHR